MKVKIKKGEQVKILTGKDKGNTGKVIRIDQKRNLVTVEGLNLFKRHKKPRRQGEKGEIVNFAKPLHRSNVMHVDEVKRRQSNRERSKLSKI